MAFLTTEGLDYETQREYRVTVTATDPSGESDSVNVIVNITNVNEGPDWTTAPPMRVYLENGTADVADYLAEDPEGSGITYSFVTSGGAVAGTNVDPMTGTLGTPVEAGVGQFEDYTQFDISSTRGILTFKSSPNYEDPQDTATTTNVAAGDNMYQLVVKAEVADDENPRHATIQPVTVIVINENEAPVFAKTTDTLAISENPDDPEKEATSDRGELYLLNRGVGKPAANLPAAPDLDVGIPVVAVDDDNTWLAESYLGDTGTRATRPIQLIDGLTYELIGADAAPFHIVPATGQILTREKLDYEIKNEYKFMVKATDPLGLTGSIDMTINVTDVDEVPIVPILMLAGPDAPSYAEHDTAAVGTYSVTGDRGEAVSWTKGGADGSHFTLTGNGTSATLTFTSAPDYEDPKGGADSDSNTYMVTVSAEAGGDMETVEVTVTVTNAEEPGTVTLDPMHPSVGTAVTAILADADGVLPGTVNWVWATAGADGNYSTVSTASAATTSYTPVGDDVGKHLRASVTYNDGFKTGNEEMAVSTSVVTQVPVNVAPEFPSASTMLDISEDAAANTDIGIPIAATDANGDTLTYTLEGTDAASFGINSGSGQLSTSAALDYETKDTYSVVVKATDPGGLSDTIEVTINVTDVDEVVPPVVEMYAGDDGRIDLDELFEAIDDLLRRCHRAQHRRLVRSHRRLLRKQRVTQPTVGRRVIFRRPTTNASC